MIEHIKDILASDLLERYVLGDVSPAEKVKVEMLCLDHKVIRDEVLKLETAIEKVGIENAIKAPTAARECIMKSISQPATTSHAIAKNVGINAWWKIAAALVIGSLAMWLYMQNDLNNSKNIIEEQLSELEILHRDCDLVTQQYAFINHTNTVPVLLEGTDQAPESQVVIYWNEALEKSMMRVVELPSIQENETYQLWADVHGEMLSLGTFDAGSAIIDAIEMKYLAEAESLNITIEPLGGSDRPTVSRLTASKAI